MIDVVTNEFTPEDWYFWGHATAPVDRWAIARGQLALESWRRQRADCRPRWLRFLLTRGYVMQTRHGC